MNRHKKAQFPRPPACYEMVGRELLSKLEKDPDVKIHIEVKCTGDQILPFGREINLNNRQVQETLERGTELYDKTSTNLRAELTWLGNSFVATCVLLWTSLATKSEDSRQGGNHVDLLLQNMSAILETLRERETLWILKQHLIQQCNERAAVVNCLRAKLEQARKLRSELDASGSDPGSRMSVELDASGSDPGSRMSVELEASGPELEATCEPSN